MKRAIVVLVLLETGVLLADGTAARAHEIGAPFSGAIIDPLSLHHAHIENEQRINFFFSQGVEAFGGRKRSASEGELEMAWSDKKFKLGSEFFIPIADIPSPLRNGREFGIGDIEIRPIKYAFVNRPDFVLTTSTGIGLPTGSRRRGLGSGNTSLTQYLFMDKAVGNWFLGVNLAPNVNVAGESGSGLEYGVVLSYSFIRGTRGTGLAAPLPAQPLVISPSLEFLGDARFSGAESGTNATALLPGLTLWWTRSGWQAHVGVQLATSGAREADRVFLVQLGNHVNWGQWFGGRHRD